MKPEPRMVRWTACLAFACLASSPAKAQPDAPPEAEPDAPAETESEQGAAVPVPEEPEPAIDLEQVLRGQGRGMTADRAAERAVATAPSVDRAREAVAETRQGARKAMVGLVPELAVSARYTRLSNVRNDPLLSDAEEPTIEAVSDPAARELWNGLASDPLPLQRNRYSFVGTVSFPVSDVFLEVLPRWEAAQGMAEAQRLRVRAEASKAALSAREAFYRYARARGALAVARIAERQAELREQQVDALEGIGRVGRADVLRVRAQTASARVSVARAEGGVEIAATGLRTLLHLAPDEPIAVGEDVLAELPEHPASRRALIEKAVRRRPEARALRRMIAARQRAVDGAEGKRYPSMVVGGGVELGNPHTHVFPETEEWRLSARVNVILQWSLHDTLQGGREAAQARAEAGQAKADLRALQDSIVQQVTEAHVDYLSARKALEAARLGVAAAEESYRVRMAQFRGGDAVVRELVDASASQARAQLELVDAAIDARLALARLQRAVGAEDEALPEPRED